MNRPEFENSNLLNRSAQTWNRNYFCLNTSISVLSCIPPSFPGCKFFSHILGKFIPSQSVLVLKDYPIYNSSLNSSSDLSLPDQQLHLGLRRPEGKSGGFPSVLSHSWPWHRVACVGVFWLRIGVMIWFSHSLFKVCDLWCWGKVGRNGRGMADVSWLNCPGYALSVDCLCFSGQHNWPAVLSV